MSYESENRLKIFSSVVVKPVQTGFVIPTGHTIMPQGYQYQWIDVPHEEVVQAVRKPTRDYVRSVPGDVWMPKAYQGQRYCKTFFAVKSLSDYAANML